ncbi:MAG: glycosyltransferase family 39 protein [Chloroflexi bacterium]|nr:glycosyltransferase family 39 protein [Chloroflexota bacterium]
MRALDWGSAAILLLFAAGLRIIGISYGHLNPEYFPSYAPYGMTHEQLPIQPDEFFNVSIPVNMALRNRRNPEFFNYPSFIINTNFVLFRLTGSLDGLSFAEREGRNLRNFAAFPLYVFSRSYSVFGGLIALACVYSICRIVAGRYAALCAGLLVAVCFTLVQHGHYIKPGSLATGWMMLATWASVVALHSHRRAERERFYALAGVFTGLAVTTRYNALAVAPFVLAVGLILLYRHRSPSMRRSILISWLAIPLVFFLGSPYILRDFDHFLHDVSYILGQYVSTGADVPDYFLVDHWTGMFYLLLSIPVFGVGLVATLCAGLALISAGRSLRDDQRLLHHSRLLVVGLIALTIALYALVALRTIRPLRSDHHVMLILPQVIILSALGADWLVKRAKLPRRLAMPAIALLLVIQPLVLSLQFVKMLSQPDTRQLMLEWIHANTPARSRFFLNGPYNVPLDEAIYPNAAQYLAYAPALPSGDQYDYLIYSDALAFDIIRSVGIVPPDIIQEQHSYLAALDARFARVAEVRRPRWLGSEAIMYSASYWHNPTLILYCLNAQSCDNHR